MNFLGKYKTNVSVQAAAAAEVLYLVGVRSTDEQSHLAFCRMPGQIATTVLVFVGGPSKESRLFYNDWHLMFQGVFCSHI